MSSKLHLTASVTIANCLTQGVQSKVFVGHAEIAVTQVVANRKLISGGTGTGKTTLLNILADFIPDEERILLIEDTAELNIRKSNLVRFRNPA